MFAITLRVFTVRLMYQYLYYATLKKISSEPKTDNCKMKSLRLIAWKLHNLVLLESLVSYVINTTNWPFPLSS